MINIRDILKEKGHHVFSVTPDTSVYESLEKMSSRNIGSVLVMEDEKLLGIFTERDYLKKVVLFGRSSKTTTVREIMTTNLVCVSPADSVDNTMAIMTKMHCRHLPVIDEGKLVGLVSMGDIVKKKISDMDATIKYLSEYISSSNYN